MAKSKYQKDKKSGLYYKYVKTGFYKLDGTPEYKKIRAKTIKLLDEKIEKFQYETMMGLVIDDEKLTLSEWADYWMRSYKGHCKENASVFYRCMLQHILPILGNRRIRDIREAELQKLLYDIANSTHGNNNKPYSEKTVKDVRSVLFSLFETAKNNRIIIGNPAVKLKTAGAPKKDRREMNDTERESFKYACFEHSFGLFGAVLYYLGLRRGEALALKHGDIGEKYVKINKQFTFPKNSQPVLSSPKTEAGNREIIIPEKLKELFLYWGVGDGNDPDEYIFTDYLNNPLSYSQFRRRWQSFITFSLGENSEITPHYVRHNYCTMLYDSGVDLQTAKEYMGHEDIETTIKVYTHLSRSRREKSNEKIINI